ncbi:IS1595 family transposase [Phenylobacterium sp.]|uniref:IS1595 family transposase n=1 Tax=Phenylobacterium sp. TaxID=1871053 RepID=UPI00286C5A2B|nr:IS1595 family transposase [Phenylobacterium sp.]
MSALSAKHFHDERAAYRFVEAHVWPDGPVCPHCGGFSRIYDLKGKSTRMGVRKCGDCRKPFTVKVGTIFEASNVKLHLWLQAMFLLCSSKKGFSANQLHRTLGVTLKTAWFMAHRIREAMRSGDLAPFGVGGGAVEADETYIGREPGKPVKRAFHHKMKVFTLVDRESGRARSMVVDNIRPATLAPIILENLAREARLMTDEAGHYLAVGREFAQHGVVRHGQDEYVSTEDRTIHTNTIEGYFSVFKKGTKGVYQHCSKRHLHRYLAEYDFRYNERVANGVNDVERTSRALSGIVGKRLKYRDSFPAAV